MIAVATDSVSLNSQRITNLAAAVDGTDALNRDTADARYLLQAAGGALDMNGYKIVNAAPGTDLGDVMVVE